MRFAAMRFAAAAAVEVSVDPHDKFWAGIYAADTTSNNDFEVRDLCATLTAEQRHIIIARYVDNDTMGEIARSLSVSVPAVSQRLNTIHRALLPVVAAAVAA